MTGKKTRSYKVNEDLDELMRERDDVNWSGIIRSFLQEYVASGKGTEAALSVRLEQLESDITELEGELRRLREERDRIQSALDEKAENRREVFESFASLDVNGGVDASNPAVRNYAEKLGMSPEVFLSKYREWKA